MTPSPRRAIHAGWSRSGIVSPHEEIIVRDDGMMCLYTSGELYAGRLPQEVTADVFHQLARSDLPMAPSSNDRIGDLPGAGGCGQRTRGLTLTVVEPGQPPRTARVLVDRGSRSASSFPMAEVYLEGDRGLDAKLAGWFLRLLHAADHATAMPTAQCSATLIGQGDRRSFYRRRLWAQLSRR